MSNLIFQRTGLIYICINFWCSLRNVQFRHGNVIKVRVDKMNAKGIKSNIQR